MNGHKARIQFYNASDSLRDYVWGDIVSPDLNSHGNNTIVFYQNVKHSLFIKFIKIDLTHFFVFSQFGQSQVTLTEDTGSLRSRIIQDFVRKLDGNRTFPVPTRPLAPVPEEANKQITIFLGDGATGEITTIL